MKIPEYKSLQEKNEAFGDNYQRISTLTELKSFLEETNSFEKYIYRGVCEAKYKNYTSAQRRYIVNELFFVNIWDLIKKQIDCIKEEHNQLIDCYYKSLNITPNDFLYLGIAQHYGGISPLLDFTIDLKTALYFMIDGACFPPQGTDEVGNYSSLYFIQTNRFINYESLLSDVFSTVSMNLDSLLSNKEINSSLSNEDIINILSSFDNFKDLRDRMDSDIYFLIPNKKKAKSINFKGKNRRIKGVFTISNLNIAAQNGCFVFFLPKEQKNPFERPLHCVDIHKSLIPYIKEYIGLTKSDIYPNNNDIVKNAYNKALRSILDEMK